MPRIVSLIASSTEILCALGFQSALVGRSHECDFPESVRHLPSCTEPKFDIRLASGDIDARVRSLVSEALSVYRVDAVALRAMRPDLIVTQTQCEVCAVSERDVAGALESWLDSRPQIVSLRAESLAGVWDDIARVATALHVPERGDELVRRLRARLDALGAQCATLPWQPRVASIEWIEPLMAAGNWMPELVEAAGGTSVFDLAGRHSPSISWDDLVASDPDVIVVAPCGFDLERTRTEFTTLAAHPAWPGLRAVRAGQVFVADGNQYFNRPGPRLVESAELLAAMFHPAVFQSKPASQAFARIEAP